MILRRLFHETRVLALLLIIGLATGTWVVAAVLAIAAVAAHRYLANQAALTDEAAVLTDPVKAKEVLTLAPPKPDFTVAPEDETAPTTLPAPTPGPVASGDSVEAANFRAAAILLQERLAIRVPDAPWRDPRLAADLGGLQAFGLLKSGTSSPSAVARSIR